MSIKSLSLSAVLLCAGLSLASAAAGSWKFGTEDRGHPELRYEKNGELIFFVGCGHAFGLHAVYPGTPKEEGHKAAITIAAGAKRMTFNGEIESGEGLNYPPGATGFLQWDLGYARQDPGLYGKKWKELESRLFDLLDSGRALTITAEDRSYVLPPVNVPRWKARFKKIC